MMETIASSALASFTDEITEECRMNSDDNSKKSINSNNSSIKKITNSIAKKPIRVIFFFCFITIIAFFVFLIQKSIYIFEYISSNDHLLTLIMAKLTKNEEQVNKD